MKEVTRGRTIGWKRLALLAVAVLAIAVTTGVANATTKINVDAGWQSFITGGGVDGASTAGPWVFTSTTVTKVTVTDAFCRGDEFRVYDKDVLIGQTSEVASDFPACPFELFFPAEARADAALADPASATASSTWHPEATRSSSRTRRSGQRQAPAPARSSASTAPPSSRTTARTTAG